MSIQVRWVGGTKAGEAVEFSRDVGVVRLGRDERACQIVVPPDQTMVGRVHCELRWDGAKWRLHVPDDHRVTLDGQRVRESSPLEGQHDVQLGPDGPRLLLAVDARSTLAPTATQGDLSDFARSGDGPRQSLPIGTGILGVAIVGLVVAGLGASRLWRITEARVDHLDQRVDQLAETSTNDASRVRALEARLLTAQARQQPLTEEWKSLAERATPAVFLVLRQNREGFRAPYATAWVIDAERGILATNAHVARKFQQLGDGESLWVRQAGRDPVEARVVAVDVHPGYEQFANLWRDFDPVRPVSSTSYSMIRQAGPACDVGLLRTPVGTRFPQSLALADADTLQQLASGEAVMSLGFPMEGIALGGVNLDRPAPVVHLGFVSTVTDYFGGLTGDTAQRLLVQHALPEAGGASGSPLLNRRGEVVAIHNAGSVLGTIGDYRVESSAAVFFSQRSDLIRELLDGVAEERQVARRQAWDKSIARYFRPRVQLEEAQVVARRQAEWIDNLASTELVAASAAEVTHADVGLETSREGGSERSAVWRFKLPDDGYYLLMASCRRHAGRLWGEVTDLEAQTSLGVAEEYGAEWYFCTPFAHRASRTIVVQLRADSPDAAAAVKLFRAVIRPASLDELLERRLQQWQRQLNEWATETPTATKIHDAAREIIAGNPLAEDRWATTLGSPGDYLVLAARDDHRDLDFNVADADDYETLASDEQVAPVAYASFRVEKPTKIRITFNSAEPGQFRLLIYRAPLSDNDHALR